MDRLFLDPRTTLRRISDRANNSISSLPARDKSGNRKRGMENSFITMRDNALPQNKGFEFKTHSFSSAKHAYESKNFSSHCSVT
jgi:hypothetical protein